MEFLNHTSFPALAFGGVDQQEQDFHVVVLRQTLTWNDTGTLVFADEQQSLCEADEYFDANLPGEVRQESDLCQYKPRCDVIVNATASPLLTRDGTCLPRIPVRVSVRRPDVAIPIPPMPYGLNPGMRASDEELRAWHAAVEHARTHMQPGESLVDKTLIVTGERFYVRQPGQPQWTLTEPAPCPPHPVRLADALGGQCRIDASHPAATRIPAQYCLTPEQIQSHPDAAHPPAAHEAFATNPTGKGFTRNWHLDATGATVVPAPRIEYPQVPIGLVHFDYLRAGGATTAHASAAVAGLGVRPKGHPDRANLVGTIDEAFCHSDAPLPEDFDFAVWNAAWPDQQTDLLQGDEVIELINLCAPDTPAAWRDTHGNTILRLQLPGHLPFMLVRFEDGALGELEARLDTLLIEPEEHRISLVWRATVATEPEIRVLEARMLDRDTLRALRQASQPQGAPHV